MLNLVLFVILQVCYVRVLDYRRKFIEVVQRYLDLFYKIVIYDEERMIVLKYVLICIMFVLVGLQR